jgi:hypothetical protein
MTRSMESYGQLSPIVVVREQDRWELIDGFKRLGAARKLQAMHRLLARRIETDERGAKAAIYAEVYSSPVQEKNTETSSELSSACTTAWLSPSVTSEERSARKSRRGH